MKKEIFIVPILFLCIVSAKCQKWILPKQDADSLSVSNIEIEIDESTQNVNIKKSIYDRQSVTHSHYNYQTSIYEIDTILLRQTQDESQIDLRFLLCNGREFKVTDPYTKKKKRTYFADNNKLRLGYWMAHDDTYSKLESITKQLNQSIPKKESCNDKRDLKSYRGHNYQVGKDQDNVYFQGMEFPEYEESNSIHSRQLRTQEYLKKCLPDNDEPIVFKLSLVIDSLGFVKNSTVSDECPNQFKETIINCTKNMKWRPAKIQDKRVISKIHLLIGLNTSDKYEIWDKISKLIPSNDPLESVNDASLNLILGSSNSKPETIFKVVEEMPKLIDKDYFNKITTLLEANNPSKNIDIRMQLVVEKDGRVSGIKLLRSNIGELDEQTKSLILSSLMYTPGKQRGKNVRVQIIEKLSSK